MSMVKMLNEVCHSSTYYFSSYIYGSIRHLEPYLTNTNFLSFSLPVQMLFSCIFSEACPSVSTSSLSALTCPALTQPLWQLYGNQADKKSTTHW